jgi:hypothetical protein
VAALIVGWKSNMPYNTERLLQEADRGWELLLGWICALISAVVGGFSILGFYIVAFWKPHNGATGGLPRTDTLVFLGVLAAVSVGFSVLAIRLIHPGGGQSTLMSPFLLRAWGSLFILGSAVGLILAVAKGQATQILRCGEALAMSLTMACAAFVLAGKREQRDVNRHLNSQPDAPPNGGPAMRSGKSGVRDGPPSVS